MGRLGGWGGVGVRCWGHPSWDVGDTQDGMVETPSGAEEGGKLHRQADAHVVSVVNPSRCQPKEFLAYPIPKCKLTQVIGPIIHAVIQLMGYSPKIFLLINKLFSQVMALFGELVMKLLITR